MTTCKCCGSIITNGNSRTWDEIPSCFNWSRRAVEVALVQNSPIVFYGNVWASIIAEATKILDKELAVYHVKPCPCGNFRSAVASCTCSVRQIQSWERKRDFQRALSVYHLWIEIHDADGRLDIHQNRTEKIADIVSRSKRARDKLSKIDSNLIEDSGQSLLQAWDRQSHMSYRLPAIKHVATSIASLSALYSSVNHLSAVHIAESIQYQRKNW